MQTQHQSKNCPGLSRFSDFQNRREHTVAVDLLIDGFGSSSSSSQGTEQREGEERHRVLPAGGEQRRRGRQTTAAARGCGLVELYGLRASNASAAEARWSRTDPSPASSK